MNEPLKVAIIGGGISGLSAAYFLERTAQSAGRPIEIDLFESSSRIGGKIHSVRQDGLILELGAESFLSRKTAALKLCRELGIAEDLRGTRTENRKTFVWHHDQLHQLPKGLSGFVPGNMNSLFSTSLLNLSGKCRVAADYLIPAKKGTEDESLANFMTRRLGKQAYQRLVQPLLCGIYAGDGDQLSLRATYPELRQLERDAGSLIRGLKRRQQTNAKSSESDQPLPPFLTLKTGMSELIEATVRSLNTTQIHLNAKVDRCETMESQWHVQTNSEIGPKLYHSVLLTCPAFAAAQALRASATELSDCLASIQHVSTATVNLWYDSRSFSHPLEGYGFVIPSSQQRGLTAVTWTSSKHHDRAPENLRLIRGYVGRAGAEVADGTSDQALLEVVLDELKRTMQVDDQPAGYRIQRWMKGSPQYTMGHCDTLKKIDESLTRFPGLYLSGASYRGVGIPDCIREASNAVTSMFEYLKENSQS